MSSTGKNPFKHRNHHATRDLPITPSRDGKLKLELQLECPGFARRDSPYDVFIPKLQRYSEPEEAANTSSCQVESENRHIDWRDITRTWKGLSFAQAEELAVWAQCLMLVLETYAADIIEKSFHSSYSHAAVLPLSERVRLMMDFIQDVGTASFEIDPTRLLEELINAYRRRTSSTGRDHWLAGPYDPHQNLANFLTTLDCFAPSAANVAIYTARLSARHLHGGVIYVQGRMDWYPSRPFFLNLQPTALEQSEYFITPRYKEYRFCSVIEDANVTCQHVATSDLIPMTWDQDLETFRSWISFTPASRPTVHTRVTTLATKHFPGGVRFERVMRCRLALNIVPRKQQPGVVTIRSFLATNDQSPISPYKSYALRSLRSTPALRGRQTLDDRSGPASQSLRVARPVDILRDVSQHSHRVQGTAAPVYGYDSISEEYHVRPDTPILRPQSDTADDLLGSPIPSQFELQAESSHPEVATTYEKARGMRQRQRAKLSALTGPEMEWVLRPKATQVRTMTGTTIKHNPDEDSLPDYDDGHRIAYAEIAGMDFPQFPAPASNKIQQDTDGPQQHASQTRCYNHENGTNYILGSFPKPVSTPWKSGMTSGTRPTEHYHYGASEAQTAADMESQPQAIQAGYPSIRFRPSKQRSKRRILQSIRQSIDYVLNDSSCITPSKRTISSSAKESPTKQLRRNKASQDLRQIISVGESVSTYSPRTLQSSESVCPGSWSNPWLEASPPYPIPCDEQTLDTDQALYRAGTKDSSHIGLDQSSELGHRLAHIAPSNSSLSDGDLIHAQRIRAEPRHVRTHPMSLFPQSVHRSQSHDSQHNGESINDTHATMKGKHTKMIGDPRMDIERLLCATGPYRARTEAGLISAEPHGMIVQASTRSSSSGFDHAALDKLLQIPRRRPQAIPPPSHSGSATDKDNRPYEVDGVLGVKSASRLNSSLDRILDQKGRNPSDKHWLMSSPSCDNDVSQGALNECFMGDSYRAGENCFVPGSPRFQVNKPRRATRGTFSELWLSSGDNIEYLNYEKQPLGKGSDSPQAPSRFAHSNMNGEREHIGPVQVTGPEKSRVDSGLNSLDRSDDVANEQWWRHIFKHRSEKGPITTRDLFAPLQDLSDGVACAGEPFNCKLIDHSGGRKSPAMKEPAASASPAGMAKTSVINIATAVPDDLEDFQLQIDRRLAGYSAEAQAGSSPRKSLSSLTPSVTPSRTPEVAKLSADKLQAQIQHNFREFEEQCSEAVRTRQVSMGSVMSLEDETSARMHGLFLEMESFTDDRSDLGTSR